MDINDIIGLDSFVAIDDLPISDVEQTADEGLVGLDPFGPKE